MALTIYTIESFEYYPSHVHVPGFLTFLKVDMIFYTFEITCLTDLLNNIFISLLLPYSSLF